MASSGESIGVEITPEPTPRERDAIIRALATAGLLDRSPGLSGWWRDGLRDEIEGCSETTFAPPSRLCRYAERPLSPGPREK
jgi:hypothetical protein